VSRLRALALCAFLPSLAPAQTPTPTPTPGRKPVLTRADTKDFSSTGGSSLADIVRRSKEQRERDGQTPKKSLGVITNENLKGPDTKTAGAKMTKAATPTPGTTPAANANPIPRIPEFRDAKGRNESDWKGLMNNAQARVVQADLRIKQLQDEARKLENDFYAWSDGNYRDRVIKPAWDKALEDLKKARDESDAARQAMSDLEEEARKSGTPPGWLR
jgi:hypothetical protein